LICEIRSCLNLAGKLLALSGIAGLLILAAWHAATGRALEVVAATLVCFALAYLLGLVEGLVRRVRGRRA
jgi:hypothetical protein